MGKVILLQIPQKRGKPTVEVVFQDLAKATPWHVVLIDNMDGPDTLGRFDTEDEAEIFAERWLGEHADWGG